MDKALKQRLVGAIVLIALAVIVLPMIFGGRPPSTGPEARSIELPAVPPDLEFETRRFPVGDEQARGPAPGRTPNSDRAGQEDESSTVAALPEPDESALAVAPQGGEAGITAESAETAVEEEGAAAGNEAGGSMDTLVAGLIATEGSDSDLRYVVQVASFGSDDNAVRLGRELEESGYAVMLDHVSSDTGQLNRVRVGPYATEAEAEAVVAALQARISGLKPRIVDMQPDEAGPALASEDPLMRWIVQVGSFGSQDNARDLVSRLRASGLSAFDETLRRDTSTIYRVRVGPYLDRAKALEAEQKIADEMGIDGVVMSAD
jgi:DedD protein